MCFVYLLFAMTAVILIYSWSFPMEKTYIYYWYKQFQNISFPFSFPCKMKFYQHLDFYQHFQGCLHHLQDHAQANLTSLTATRAPRIRLCTTIGWSFFILKPECTVGREDTLSSFSEKFAWHSRKQEGNLFHQSLMLVWQLEPNQHHPYLVISLPTPTSNPHHEDSTLVVLN